MARVRPSVDCILLLIFYNVHVEALIQRDAFKDCPTDPGYVWSNGTINGTITCYNTLATTVNYGFDLTGHYNQYTTINPNADPPASILAQPVSNYTCPTPIDTTWCSASSCSEDPIHYDCRSYAYCYLPTGSVDARSASTNCSTNSGTLSSLAIFNAVAIVVSLVFGHNEVRRKMPSLSKSEHWSPWAGILNAVLQIIGMLVAAELSINKARYAADFVTLLGLWTMRPRVALGVMILPSLKQSRSYLYTRADLLVSEGILCILSAVFAVHFINEPAGQTACLPPFYSLQGVHHVHNVFYVTAITGFVGLGVLCRIVVYYIQHRKALTSEGNEWYIAMATLNAIVSFATNWIIWGLFVRQAGNTYCPNNIVGTGVAWGVALLLNGIIRPLFGGADGSYSLVP